MIDIDFDDIPEVVNSSDFLPTELQGKARHLPQDKAYTLLELQPEGSGHNSSLLSVGATCFRMGVSFDDTLDHLQSAYSPDRMDYETAPRRAVLRIWEAEGDLAKLVDNESTFEPDEKEELLLRFRCTPVSSIIEASPAPLATNTIEIISRLFKDGEIVNIQKTALEYGTLVKVEDLPGFLQDGKATISDYKFLNPAHFKKVAGVPNPLHAKNKVSTRCNENVKARPWVVLEMDSNDQSRTERFNTFVMTMAKFAPLVLAVDTGNKSIHYWFDAHDVSAKVRGAFFTMACLHGADKRLAVKSQIARMPNVPGGDDGRGPQKVVYFDPAPSPGKWDLKGFEKYFQKHKQLDYYYHPTSGRYMTRDNLASWVSMDRVSLRSHLGQAGFRDAKLEGETVSPMDIVINAVQLDKNVEAVVPGASGRHAGVYEENGHRIIVTKSPVFIKPRRGSFPTTESFLVGLLGHCDDQLDILYGWLQDSLRKLRNDGKRRASWGPAQMLHLMGQANSGKTLLLKDILTPIFANRAASADPLFKKNPDMHNSDTFACELLFLDDSPVLEGGYQFRQEFGERIKSYVVGVAGGMRGMHQGRINIRPWWRFVRLMNMEPSTLATLPPLDDGVEDKLIFLYGEDMQLGPLAAAMKAPGWYERVRLQIENELPALVHFLLHEYELPEHLKDPKQRYAVASYKNPHLLAEMRQGSPESNLIYRIDNDAKGALFGDDMFNTGETTQQQPWKGGAEQLYEILAAVGSRTSQQRFSKYCPSPRILLSQLRTIEKQSTRVGYSKRLDDWPNKNKGCEYWVIFPRVVSAPIAPAEIDIGDLL